MPLYHCELFCEERSEMQINILIAPDTAEAIAFLDSYFLELHHTKEETPTYLRLLLEENGEEIAKYDMHFDAVA
jgi:hemerythrin-like domain-containing protein